MAGKANILSTIPWTYIDKAGQPVNGFKVVFEIVSSGEQHYIYVPNLHPNTVQSEISGLIAQRENLNKLSF